MKTDKVTQAERKLSGACIGCGEPNPDPKLGAYETKDSNSSHLCYFCRTRTILSVLDNQIEELKKANKWIK